MEQFRNFYSYINQIDRWGMRSGIVKIIPPKEWSEQLPHLGQESLRTDGKGQMLRNAKIKSPISQVIQGSRGLFRVMNVAKRKTYNALGMSDSFLFALKHKKVAVDVELCMPMFSLR
jgi:hypothetical protein